MLEIIITILVIIVLIGLVIWGFQLKNNRAIQQLDSQVATLDDGSITGLIRNIDQLGTAGASLTQFNAQRQAYQELAAGPLTDLQTALLDVEQANKQFRFKAVREDLQTLGELRDATQQHLGVIHTALQQLQASEAENRAQLNRLRDAYQEARKTVLAKSFAYGEALAPLEAALQDISAQLATINATNVEGDYDLAKKQVHQAKLAVAAVQNQVKQLPPLVNTVVNEFPAQLSEIERGYEQLAARNFHFTDSVPDGVVAVRDLVTTAEEEIRTLDVTALSANTATIANQIDGLYALMEKELDAKATVDQTSGDLRQFISHALKQNHTLLIELDHLNQSYALNHDELKTVTDLRGQIETIQAGYVQAIDRIDDHTAIFSQVRDSFASMKEDLKAIELKQQAINTSVAGLRETEQKAVNQASQFEMTLRDIKYEVSRHGLPGLPKDYLAFFRVVTKEVDTLNHDLNQIKIDLDAIAKLLIKIATDIDTLRDESRNVVDAAALTEQLLQYANRYKATHEDIGKAVEAAHTLYGQYNYQQAADVIGAALERIEPGSVKKVQDDYNASKGADLF
ncbi:septation ring formation regulator EzrA [Lacticaseibacillus daqingensis]|uniref:septation ring formation regulator EzrA n=1 Tax=Lacticaseibacillus daqingensis TaxID=2486014 RepID=UPI000F7B2CDB|nr:septation ring formation regulator EzrA [Lacticaseibacillus daqingensis]